MQIINTIRIIKIFTLSIGIDIDTYNKLINIVYKKKRSGNKSSLFGYKSSKYYLF